MQTPSQTAAICKPHFDKNCIFILHSSFSQNIQAILAMAKLPKTLQLMQLIRSQLEYRVHDHMMHWVSEKCVWKTRKVPPCFCRGFAWVDQDQRSNMAEKKWRLQVILHLTVISDNHSVTLLCDLLTLKRVSFAQ